MIPKPGDRIALTYPDATTVGAIGRFRRRQIQVIRVRDLISEPLTIQEYLRRPLVCRSRWLIRGFDLEAKQFRQFYLGSSAEFPAPGVLKVALYEPGGKCPVYAISDAFEPTRHDRRLLAKALIEWSRRDLSGLELRIYSDDLRTVG